MVRKSLLVCVSLLGVSAALHVGSPAPASAQDAVLLGHPLTLQSCTRPPWGTLRVRFSTPDCAYAWQYAGIQEPDYGAFAENFTLAAPRPVRGVRLWITGLGVTPTTGCDVFLWSDAGGVPGAVLAATTFVPSTAAPIYPLVGCLDIPIPRTTVPTNFWAGFAGNWAGSVAEFYVAGDLSSGSWTSALTNIAPGIGYPTGWNSPTIVWGPVCPRGIAMDDESDGSGGSSGDTGGDSSGGTSDDSGVSHAGQGFSLGIGAWVEDDPTPARESSWGAIKGLFR